MAEVRAAEVRSLTLWLHCRLLLSLSSLASLSSLSSLSSLASQASLRAPGCAGCAPRPSRALPWSSPSRCLAQRTLGHCSRTPGGGSPRARGRASNTEVQGRGGAGQQGSSDRWAGARPLGGGQAYGRAGPPRLILQEPPRQARGCALADPRVSPVLQAASTLAGGRPGTAGGRATPSVPMPSLALAPGATTR